MGIAIRPDSYPPEIDLRQLYLLTRRLRDAPAELAACVSDLFSFIEAWSLGPLHAWDRDQLAQARHFAEEITIGYVSRFHTLTELPVTFYKREKAVRRGLDQRFSRIFREIIRRSGASYQPELITEEPIYYLCQVARERSFPKTARGQGRHPRLETLRIRFHVALSTKLDPEARGAEDRRVLLPFEIK